METRPFIDAATEPDEDALRVALGPAFSTYEDLLARTSGYVRDWSYSKSSGWMLKVHDRRKALLYVIPLRDCFRVSMAIRESERDALLAVDGLEALRPQLAAARKAPEGFACYSDVGSGADWTAVGLLVSRLAELRKA